MADLYKFTWIDNVFELITGNQYVKIGLVTFCLAVAVVGIILLGIYIPEASKNPGTVAIGIALIFIGGFFSFMVYKMEPPPHPDI